MKIKMRKEKFLQQNKIKTPDFEINGVERIGELEESTIFGPLSSPADFSSYICHSLFTPNMFMNGAS